MEPANRLARSRRPLQRFDRQKRVVTVSKSSVVNDDLSSDREKLHGHLERSRAAGPVLGDGRVDRVALPHC